jgi:hypothetical protein
MRGTRTRILKKYNRRRSKRYSKKSKRHTRKNVYSKTYKKIQKGGLFCNEKKKQIQALNEQNNILRAEYENLKKQCEIQKKMKNLDKESSIVISDLKVRISRLQQENYKLEDELEKLKKQKLPTEDQINAVTLDDNDNTEIEKMLDSQYNYVTRIKTEEMQVGNEIKIMSIDEYKKENREKAIREYKIKKLMGENSE